MSDSMDEVQWLVRRLTPLECERLQGFPDYWTFIGDWKDEKGKVHKEADSPKYKALGNSICLPFWYELAANISAEYKGRKPTMTSLFAGIGGFDLIWHWLNGADSVPNVSEIEPFPCAVLERHFGENGDWEQCPKPAWFKFVDESSGN